MNIGDYVFILSDHKPALPVRELAVTKVRVVDIDGGTLVVEPVGVDQNQWMKNAHGILPEFDRRNGMEEFITGIAKFPFDFLGF